MWLRKKGVAVARLRGNCVCEIEREMPRNNYTLSFKLTAVKTAEKTSKENGKS